jgi:glutamine amidotransferase
VSLDLSAMNGPDDRIVIVATEPLTAEEAWQPLGPGECRVFVDGEEVWSHRNAGTRTFPVTASTVGRPWAGVLPAAPLALLDVAR